MTPQRAVVAVAVWLGVGTGDDVTVLVCVFDGVDVDVPVFVGVLVEVGVQVGCRQDGERLVEWEEERV